MIRWENCGRERKGQDNGRALGWFTVNCVTMTTKQIETFTMSLAVGNSSFHYALGFDKAAWGRHKWFDYYILFHVVSTVLHLGVTQCFKQLHYFILFLFLLVSLHLAITPVAEQWHNGAFNSCRNFHSRSINHCHTFKRKSQRFFLLFYELSSRLFSKPVNFPLLSHEGLGINYWEFSRQSCIMQLCSICKWQITAGLETLLNYSTGSTVDPAFLGLRLCNNKTL